MSAEAQHVVPNKGEGASPKIALMRWNVCEGETVEGVIVRGRVWAREREVEAQRRKREGGRERRERGESARWRWERE